MPWCAMKDGSASLTHLGSDRALDMFPVADLLCIYEMHDEGKWPWKDRKYTGYMAHGYLFVHGRSSIVLVPMEVLLECGLFHYRLDLGKKRSAEELRTQLSIQKE